MSTTITLPARLGMAAGDHHRPAAAHRMADDRRPLEPRFPDIAGDLLGDRRQHRPGRIGAGRPAGEAGDVDEMVAIAGHRRDRAVPDVAATS